MDCTEISTQIGRTALHGRVGNFTGKFSIESVGSVDNFLSNNGGLCHPSKLVGVSPDFQSVLMRDVDNTVLISFSLSPGAQVQWSLPTSEYYTIEFIGNDGLLITSAFEGFSIFRNGKFVKDGGSHSTLLDCTSLKNHEFRCMHLTKDLRLYMFNAEYHNMLCLYDADALCPSILRTTIVAPDTKLYPPRYSTLTTDPEGKYVALSVGVGHFTTRMHMINVYTADLQQLLFSLSDLISRNPILCAIDNTGILAYTLQHNPMVHQQDYPQLLVLHDVHKDKGTAVSSTELYINAMDADAQWKSMCVTPNGDVVVFRDSR